MFTNISKTNVPVCVKLGMLIPHEQEETLERSELQKIVPCWGSGEGGSCGLETKNDRRTMPRPKLFISLRRLQEQMPQP
jgi:hypothetical protein